MVELKHVLLNMLLLLVDEDNVCISVMMCSFFFFFCVPQLYLWGSPFGVRFLRM